MYILNNFQCSIQLSMEALELILNCTISSARARMNSSSLAASAPAPAPAPRLAWSSTLSLASRLNTNPYSRFSSNSRTKCFNLQMKISIHHIYLSCHLLT